MGKTIVRRGAEYFSRLFFLGLAWSGLTWLILADPIQALDFSGPKYSDPARPIQVEVGDDFAIVLEANPTTGFQWQLGDELPADVLTLVINEYQGAETDLVGAGGQDIWVFQATGPGKAVIGLEYLRPWERDSESVKTVKFTVLVKSPETPAGSSSISSAEAEQLIADQAQAVVLALKHKEFVKFSGFFHPDQGVRFSPYTYIDPDKDVILTADKITGLLGSGEKMLWGSYAGSGSPIRLSLAGYYRRFIYDRDFALAQQIGYNQFIGRSTTINNIFAVYPEAIVAEYYSPGSDPKYKGLDWKSLRLVFEKKGDIWYLVGLVHDEWTI